MAKGTKLGSSEKTLTVGDKKKLHMRPAAELVDFLVDFKSDVKISFEGHDFNAKSIFDVLIFFGKYQASKGESFILKADGEDAAEAVEGIEKMISAGLA
jgi:phosphotransferase system HPr (HPr) family protein